MTDDTNRRRLADHLELAAEAAENDGRLVDAALMRAASVQIMEPAETEGESASTSTAPTARTSSGGSTPPSDASRSSGSSSHRCKYASGPGGEERCTLCGQPRKRKPRAPKGAPEPATTAGASDGAPAASEGGGSQS